MTVCELIQIRLYRQHLTNKSDSKKKELLHEAEIVFGNVNIQISEI